MTIATQKRQNPRIGRSLAKFLAAVALPAMVSATLACGSGGSAASAAAATPTTTGSTATPSTPDPPPSTSAPTPPAQAAGYNLQFSDDFNPLSLSPNRLGNYTWFDGVWYNSVIAPLSSISASNSILTLTWNNGQGTPSTDISSCSQDGQYCHAFRYGYLEASMQWDVTKGSWPAFWMLPVEDSTGADVVSGVREFGEIDIFEGQGSTPNTFYGTIHDWKNGVDVANNNNANTFTLPGTVDLSQYHTYGLLWVPGQVTWYFDNQPLFSAATFPIFDQQHYYFIVSSQEGNGLNKSNMTGATAASIPLNVQWVHAWQQ